MAFSYKTSISFGLVYIPVQLVATVKSNRISFNQLDKKTGSRIRYKKTCDECDGQEVPPEDIVKGYEYEKHRYVIFENEDFEKIKSNRDKSIAIQQFVDYDEIDAVYYDRPYFVLPSGADKAFLLLTQAMETENKVGIAKTVLGTKETMVAIIAKNGQLTLSTMHFYDEIKERPRKEITATISQQELQMAKSIIQNMATPFDATQYKDEYTQKVLDAIQKKVAGKEITAPKESTGKIIDLMEALKLSLKEQRPKEKSTQKPAAKSKVPAAKKSTKTQDSTKKGGNKKTASKPAKKSVAKKPASSPSTPAKKPAAAAKSK